MLTDNNGQQALVPQGELIDFQPQWFSDALAAKRTAHQIPYAETEVNYWHWQYGGDQPNPAAIMFLHGNGAHARWFDFIAPALTPYYHIFSADLPGMGDSGWLKKYSREIMAEAIANILRDAKTKTKLAKPPALIAHSFGGMVALDIAADYADTLSALLICDYHARPPKEETEWFADYKARPVRLFDTAEEVMKRFRLAPDQPCANQFIVDYIAQHSITQKTIDANIGWAWKFDPSTYAGFKIGSKSHDVYKTITTPMATMFGAGAYDFETMTRREMVKYMHSLRPDVPHYDIIGARHHIMLDQPHSFINVCATQMENWRAQNIF